MMTDKTWPAYINSVNIHFAPETILIGIVQASV